MSPRFSLPHIDISSRVDSSTYLGQGAGANASPRLRDEHGRRIQNELEAALRLAEEIRPTDERLPPPTGAYLEVDLRSGTNPDALDLKRQGIKSGATKISSEGERTVALYVPNEAKPALSSIINDYLNGPLTEMASNPPNKAKVEAIEAFRAARLETFWTDAPEALPTDPHHTMWWALWCWRGREGSLEDICAKLNVRIASDNRRLYFPEVTVIPVFASRSALELILFTDGAVAEVRRASDNPTFFTDMSEIDQHSWGDDLAERIVWPASDAPAVCVLDTGVNRAHSLIEPALSITDTHAVNPTWGNDDHNHKGHGTSMAGTVLHGDLTYALADQLERHLNHRVESVKILPPRGFDATDPHSYGVVTQAAIALPEITAPYRSRVYCMAVTNQNVSGARPSAWSAAIDQAAAGTMIGDDPNSPKRLIVLSAGNIPPEPDMIRVRSQDEYPIEDPSQAWNALTVGGYTDLIDIREAGYTDWKPMAEAGDISPHSRTSVTWPQGTPFKPEIVMEAGNRAISPSRTEAITLESLTTLSTGKDHSESLVAFDGTSAACAQAARLSARIAADHPDFWPETIRALIIHSAEWTEPMLSQFNLRTSKRDRYELIRRYGYGVPDYDRATASSKSHLALFAQAEIQPFRSGGGRKYGDCHYYNLPIPRTLLVDLMNEVVDLKVTLSYFVDPNPGLGANIESQRYRSHGFRFDLRRSGEDIEIFKSRVNASERDDPKVAPTTEPDDNRWLLGPQSISAGSLHTDTWTGPAIELLDRDMLCIKPVIGWSRERSSIDICNTVRRYALIVTLKARNSEIDLYTPIATSIELPVNLPIEIET